MQVRPKLIRDTQALYRAGENPFGELYQNREDLKINLMPHATSPDSRKQVARRAIAQQRFQRALRPPIPILKPIDSAGSGIVWRRRVLCDGRGIRAKIR